MKILWDSVIITARAVEVNTPDIIVLDNKESNESLSLLFSSSACDDVSTVAEKSKYQQLAVAL